MTASLPYELTECQGCGHEPDEHATESGVCSGTAPGYRECACEHYDRPDPRADFELVLDAAIEIAHRAGEFPRWDTLRILKADPSMIHDAETYRELGRVRKGELWAIRAVCEALLETRNGLYVAQWKPEGDDCEDCDKWPEMYCRECEGTKQAYYWTCADCAAPHDIGEEAAAYDLQYGCDREWTGVRLPICGDCLALEKS